MNFTESFNEFSSKLSTMDLALYAGAGIIIWVLFKDKLSPVQKVIMDLIDKIKSKTGSSTVVVKVPPVVKNSKTENLFFDLVVSWKQTRDLAEKSGCKKAVEVADTMFPYLSPTVCGDETDAE
tara:strand:+ start:1047 stop:1415 length:369 start_codon:yes stop_codon:yes gene_type:complete